MTRRSSWCVLAVVLALLLRSIWPHADPPARLSWSTAIYTDPASKTLPARYAAERGDWKLAEAQYLRAFPLANGLTYAAYRAFGVSRHTQQILVAIISTIAFTLTLWTLRRAGPALPAAAALGATSWWLTMFGRVPVVENLVAALLAASAAFALGRGTASVAVAGALATAAAFFGKYHAIAFLPALAIFLAARHRRARSWVPLAAGAGSVFALWLATIFLPHRAEILEYVQRVSTGIHGTLPVAQSPIAGLAGIFGSVRAAWVFHHAPVLATVGLFFALRTVTSRERFRARVGDGSALFALAFVSVWIYYAFLSYKAPRYYVIVGPALLACAASQLAEWLRMDAFPRKRPRGRGWLAAALIAYSLAVVALDVLRQGLSALALAERTRAVDAPSAVVRAIEPITAFLESDGSLGLAVLVAAAGIAALLLRPTRRVSPRNVAIALVALGVTIDLGRYVDWATHRKYVIREIQAAIPSVVAGDAVLVGPFAALLTQGTGLLAVSWIDPLARDNAIERLRPTHRIEDERSATLGFDETLPAPVAGATPLVTWPFRTPNVRSLSLSRIGGTDPTPFERAVERMNANDWALALELWREANVGAGAQADALYKQATCAFHLGDVNRAGELIRRAAQLRPGSPLYPFNLGMVEQAQGNPAGARAAWKRALELDPDDTEPLVLLRSTRRATGSGPRAE